MLKGSLFLGAKVPASVRISSRVMASPASRLRVRVGAPSASTPMIRAFGFFALMAEAMPEMSPPPPMATKKVSQWLDCFIISSARVPWPAATRASAKGWT